MALIIVTAIIFMTVITRTTKVTTELYRLLTCSSKKLQRNKETAYFLQRDAEVIGKKKLWLHRHGGNGFADHSRLDRECGDKIFLRRLELKFQEGSIFGHLPKPYQSS